MAKLEYRLLEPGEIESELASLPGWHVQDDLLCREARFEKYKEGVLFAAAVGWLADGLNHHPDLLVGYGQVRISVNTHAVGGLSPYDFELARRIEKLLSPE